MDFDLGSPEDLFHYFNENPYTPHDHHDLSSLSLHDNLDRENVKDPPSAEGLSQNPDPDLSFDLLQVLDMYDIDNTLMSEGDHHLRPPFLGTYHNVVKGSSSCLSEGDGNRETTTNDNKKTASKKKRVFDSESKIIKGQWTPEEDRSLVKLVEKYGMTKWSFIAQMLSRRNGRQCRERWHNHLNPIIKKNRWSEDEDKMLINAHKQLGNKWSQIERIMPWRSENTIKNHWNATKRKQLLSSRKNKNSNSNTNSLLQNYIASVTKPDKGCLENSSSTGMASMPFYYKYVKMEMIN